MKFQILLFAFIICGTAYSGSKVKKMKSMDFIIKSNKMKPNVTYLYTSPLLSEGKIKKTSARYLNLSEELENKSGNQYIYTKAALIINRSILEIENTVNNLNERNIINCLDADSAEQLSDEFSYHIIATRFVSFTIEFDFIFSVFNLENMEDDTTNNLTNIVLAANKNDSELSPLVYFASYQNNFTEVFNNSIVVIKLIKIDENRSLVVSYTLSKMSKENIDYMDGYTRFIPFTSTTSVLSDELSNSLENLFLMLKGE